MTEYENAIEINNLSKKYEEYVLNKVSFSVPKGSVMGYIGQNGAGKTTTIRSMMNLIPIDEGEIKILGMDYRKSETDIKKRIAVVFDELPVQDIFDAKDLSYIFEGLYEEWNKGTFKEYLDRFEIPEQRKVGKLSKGMKMKLQIALALSHNAELLIMDEPTAGLDPVVRDEILHCFMEYVEDGSKSILLSSHITSDLEKIANCVTYIDKGKILLTGAKDEIIASHAIIRCDKDEVRELDSKDVISARISHFGAEVLLYNHGNVCDKYKGMPMDKASLEEIMLYYVNREKKEWS